MCFVFYLFALPSGALDETVKMAISYLEEPQDIGDHDGDHAERGAYHASYRLVRNVSGHLAVLTFVL